MVRGGPPDLADVVKRSKDAKVRRAALGALAMVPDEKSRPIFQQYLNDKDDKMRAHYDFSGGIRGKYARRYAEGANVVVLDPDVAREFPNRDAVNKTLRAVAQIIQMQGRRRDRANKRMERTRKTRRSS